MSTYDAVNEVLVVVMENGSVCKWSLDKINLEFIDMATTCWYWNGCSKESHTSNTCCRTPEEDKTASNKDIDHCYTKHLLRWDIEGQKMPNEKSCRKANGTKQTWDKIFAPGACPTELEIDDPTATVICPLQYPDGASISQTSISSSSVQER